MTQWNIRPAQENDISFIYATWLKSYHYDSWTKSIAKSVYFDNYKLVLDRLLEDSKVLIACTKEDENVILGYCVSEPGIIHYVFVKEAFRMFGIATDLVGHSIDEQQIIISHRTQSVLPILRTKDFITFNPFVLYNKE